MTFSRLLALFAILGAFAYWWKTNYVPDMQEARESPGGFVSVIMPQNQQTNAVIIFAPLNCPSDAAQRADALAARLTKMGIPNVRSASYSANIDRPSEEQNKMLQRSMALLNGKIPVVFLRGKGKSNPTAEEVAAEYRRTK